MAQDNEQFQFLSQCIQKSFASTCVCVWENTRYKMSIETNFLSFKRIMCNQNGRGSVMYIYFYITNKEVQ